MFRIPTWQQLSRLGGNRLLRTAYFWLFAVPIAARVLSGINQTATIQILGANISLNLTLPFSWKVFFYAALFTSIANALYSVFCPSVIKNYESGEEFVRSGRGFAQVRNDAAVLIERASRSWVDSNIEAINRFGWEHFTETPKVWGWPPGNIPIGDIGDLVQNFIQSIRPRSEVAVIVWALRELVDDLGVYWRAICFAFYVAGLLLIFFVLIQNVLFVTSFGA